MPDSSAEPLFNTTTAWEPVSSEPAGCDRIPAVVNGFGVPVETTLLQRYRYVYRRWHITVTTLPDGRKWAERVEELKEVRA